MSDARVALVAGATGLVGRALLSMLADDPAYSTVTVVGRRAPEIANAKIELVLNDFSDPATLRLTGDDAYCCLGTTIKLAGSQEAFRRVDCEFVIAFARAARAGGATRFAVVSAVGTDANARIFYSRVKAGMEQAVSSMGFAAVHIMRPSFLTGERTDERQGERFWTPIFEATTPLLIGPLRRYRPIAAETVARAMIGAMLSDATGVRIHEWNAMRDLAARRR